MSHVMAIGYAIFEILIFKTQSLMICYELYSEQ